MDANTKEVLMAVIALISAIVTPIVVVLAAKIQAKKIDVVEKKLDENHKLANGHFTQLLKTTAELATAQEKARGKR